MRLFIAEKPSVAKAIAAELGVTKRAEGYIECGKDIVTFCFGHLLEYADPDSYLPNDIPMTSTGKKRWRMQDLPIFPKKWIINPKADTGAKKQLKIIGDLLKKADNIVNAGDPDREGCLLVDEILDFYKNTKPVMRFWASAQDSTSIQKALANLKNNSEFKGWTMAANGRAQADWLVGMNLSRAYTLTAQEHGQKALITIGRVQTPTLSLVVNRDIEIENFKPKNFYNIFAELQHENGKFKAKWQAAENQQGLDSEGRLIDLNCAKSIIQKIKDKTGTITEYKQEAKKKNQPLAFSLSDITAIASSRFGYSADKTLKTCQSLYETHKLTSYPRTDCAYLPESQFIDAPKILNSLKSVLTQIYNSNFASMIEKCDTNIKSPTWNDKKVTAHHGIIPTSQQKLEQPLNEKEKNIYEIIVRAYLAQFYPAHEYMQTSIKSIIENEIFIAKGQIITKNGWKNVYQHDDDNKEKEENASQNLPKANNGDNVKVTNTIGQTAQTKPPARFTEGTLIRAMENIHKYIQNPEHKKLLKDGDGIGTSATRAAIIENLKTRGFLESKNKNIVSTMFGRNFVSILPESIKSPVLSAIFERILKDIECGKDSLESFIAKQQNFILKEMEKLKSLKQSNFANLQAPKPANFKEQAKKKTSQKR